MADTKSFWDAFSPYMDFLENVVGINSDNLNPIIPLIQNPVLVVGAGQGLLVGELRQKGFDAEGIDLSPQMVEYAEKRRGIKLFLGNANAMPFQDGQFKTSIVATGVIDFLDNTDQIGAITKEVRRVTDAQGEIFVAMLGMTPQTEELAKYIGIVSENNQVNRRLLYQIVWGSNGILKEVLTVIRRDPDKNILGFMIRLIRSFMSMRKRASARIRAVKALKKKIKSGEAPHPKILLDNFPGDAVLRSKEQIHELFKSMNSPPRNIFVFDNCKIARL